MIIWYNLYGTDFLLKGTTLAVFFQYVDIYYKIVSLIISIFPNYSTINTKTSF